MERLHRYATEDSERLELPAFEQVAGRPKDHPTPVHRVPFTNLGLIVVTAAALILLVATVGRSVILTEAGSSAAPTITRNPVAITADPAAFRGLGRLAFATSAGLHVLDGSSGALVRVADAGLARWSPDGSWLAYVQRGGAELWVARADGSGQQQVAGLPSFTSVAFEWSPTDSVLAVVPRGGSAAFGLWTARPSEGATLLAARDTVVWSFAWSPAGDTIAYSATLPAADPSSRSDALFTIGTRGAAAQERFVAAQAGILGIAWWPDGHGVLYYRDPEHSASMLMDGVPLESRSLDGSRKSAAFSDRRIDTFGAWIDAHRFVAILGVDRFLTANRHLAICDIDSVSCRVVGPLSSGVDMEPAVSFDRRTVAFVRAADRAQAVGFTGDTDAQSWLATRTLWILDLASGTSTPLASAGSGVLAPAWSRDGRKILLASSQSAWLYDLGNGSLHQLLTPLGPATPSTGSGWTFDWLQ